MRMKVICGNPDCREEFHVDTDEPVWECPECSREIVNRNYPFLTARLMQAKIEGDEADWKKRLGEITDEAKKEISDRGGTTDLEFLNNAEMKLKEDLSNHEWRKLHDEVLEKARNVAIELEKDR